MASDKHITGNRGLTNLTFTQNGTGVHGDGRRSSSACGRSTCTPSTATATSASSSGRSGWSRRRSPGTNLAQGRPATASTYQPTGTNGPQLPAYAVDNNYGTRWASEWVDTAWMQVDLGSVQSFNHVLLGWEAAYAKAYKVQTSNDGTTWTTIYTTTTAGNGGFDDLQINGTGRYVRMNGTGAGHRVRLLPLGVRRLPQLISRRFRRRTSGGGRRAGSPWRPFLTEGAPRRFPVWSFDVAGGRVLQSA